jgi:hypothetical protein
MYVSVDLLGPLVIPRGVDRARSQRTSDLSAMSAGALLDRVWLCLFMHAFPTLSFLWLRFFVSIYSLLQLLLLLGCVMLLVASLLGKYPDVLIFLCQFTRSSVVQPYLRTCFFLQARYIDVRCYSAFLCCIIELMNDVPPWCILVSPVDPVIWCLANFVFLLPYLQAAARSKLQSCLDMVMVEMPLSRLFCINVRWYRSTLF